jgi:hypothetical protein
MMRAESKPWDLIRLIPAWGSEMGIMKTGQFNSCCFQFKRMTIDCSRRLQPAVASQAEACGYDISLASQAEACGYDIFLAPEGLRPSARLEQYEEPQQP